MFVHSEPVPKIYEISGKILQKVVQEFQDEESITKELVYNKKKHPNAKALVITSLKYMKELNLILQIIERNEKETCVNPWLAKILITELLWGKKSLPGDSRPVKMILKYEQAIKEYETENIPTTVAPLTVVKPRYVRVNDILASTKRIIDKFKEEGWTLVECSDKRNYDGFLTKVAALTEKQFMNDIDVPSLLIFPPRTELFWHDAYKSRQILLQDKASCLPAQLLNPEPGSVVLDMCAGPGMKTTQLASLMKDSGILYAVERDEKRFRILRNLVRKAGTTCVQTFMEDVLLCDSATFPNVEYILVDPSCSGSGVSEWPDFEIEANLGRLDKLAALQVKILSHALLKFPQAKRVVYSTCSIHPQENEDVVRQVMETNYNFKLVPAKQYLNNAWKNFEDSSFGDLGKSCLYAKPTEDMTNGFFVAVFERLAEGEENPFFDNKVFNYKKKAKFKRKTKLRYEEQRENSAKNRKMDEDSDEEDEQEGNDEEKNESEEENSSVKLENAEEEISIVNNQKRKMVKSPKKTSGEVAPKKMKTTPKIVKKAKSVQPKGKKKIQQSEKNKATDKEDEQEENDEEKIESEDKISSVVKSPKKTSTKVVPKKMNKKPTIVKKTKSVQPNGKKKKPQA